MAGLSHEINTLLGDPLTLTTAMEAEVGQLARSLEAGQLLRSDLTRKVGRLGDGMRLMRTDLTRAVDLVQRFRQVASDRTGRARGPIRVKSWAGDLL